MELFLSFLVAYVLTHYLFVSSHGRHEVPPCPEVLADEIPSPPGVRARYVDGALHLKQHTFHGDWNYTLLPRTTR